MQERSGGFRHGLAELVERDLLPLLNLLVLLLPLVLLGIEFAARSAIAVTLPDSSPDVASLDTPAPRRQTLGPEDHKRTVEAEQTKASDAVSGPQLPATSPSVFSDSPLGYGE